MPAPDHDTLVLACETLTERDTALAKAHALHGLPNWRTAPAEYVTLARTVAYQQISLTAAGAIWERTLTYFGGEAKVTPQAMIDTSDEDLQSCGMSRPKIAHMKSIAHAIIAGTLNLQRVLGAPIEAAQKELLSVKGIGPWTADIFLLYSGTLDAFPAGDIGLMNAYQMLSGRAERPSSGEFATIPEQWRPYRGDAAHLLWAHFHAVREN